MIGPDNCGSFTNCLLAIQAKKFRIDGRRSQAEKRTVGFYRSGQAVSIAVGHRVAVQTPVMTIANTIRIWPMSSLVGVMLALRPKGKTAAQVQAFRDRRSRWPRKLQSQRAKARLEAPVTATKY